MVKYLVEHGARIHSDGDRAFNEAASNSHLPVVEYLVERVLETEGPKEVSKMINVENDDYLRIAAYKGDLPMIKYVVEHGADIQAQGSMMLEEAARGRSLSVFLYLVKLGFDSIGVKTQDPDVQARFDEYTTILQDIRKMKSISKVKSEEENPGSSESEIEDRKSESESEDRKNRDGESESIESEDSENRDG